MQVSLVTTVKNEAETLDELIAAVRSQSRPPDEWIVVDGGSTDRSVEILEAAGECVVLREAGNIARGRNAGIARARGRIIATTDAGCRPLPDWLERLAGALESGAGRVVAGSTRERIRGPLDAAQAALLDQFVGSGVGTRQAALSARSLAFLVDVWKRDPFPEWLDHGEDSWLLRRWARQGAPAMRLPEAIVEWRLRDSTADFLRQHFRYMRGDGRGKMNGGRHLLRAGFYGMLGLAALPVPPPLFPRWWALATWVAYAALTASRLGLLTKGRPARFRLAALCRLLALLPLMDLAKLAGYLVGRLDRLRGLGPAR